MGTSRPNFGELVRTSAPSSRPRSQGGAKHTIRRTQQWREAPEEKKLFFPSDDVIITMSRFVLPERFTYRGEGGEGVQGLNTEVLSKLIKKQSLNKRN